MLTIAYDGTEFAGSQRQPGRRTVQAVLEAALTQLAGTPVATTFAGRTDRGVHAAGQVVSCDDPRPDLDDGALARAINGQLPDDVAVVKAERRPAPFHARYDACWREYRYRIWTGVPQPLGRRWTWQRRAPLDLAAMRQAAQELVGERDLAALAGGGEGVPWSARRERPRGTVRRILACDCREVAAWWAPATEGTCIELRIVADGFLPRVVRNLAGELVEIGRGRRGANWLMALLAGGDRRAGSMAAPPQGVILWRVGYGDDKPELDIAAGQIAAGANEVGRE